MNFTIVRTKTNDQCLNHQTDGVAMITVAVGFTSETSELVGLTSPPVSENLIYVEDYESLGKLRDQLISPLCTGKT